MQSIFPSMMPGGNPGAPEALLSFKAGKMTLSGTTLTSDTRKGLIELRQSPEDSLMHFIWKDRTSGETVDDLIIFPQEAIMKRVNGCTDGIVYELKFNSSNRKLFFWSQERRKKDADISNSEHTKKEHDIVAKLNSLLDNPPPPAQASMGGFPGGMSQDQLVQMLSGAAADVPMSGAETPASGGTPANAQGSTTGSTAESTEAGQPANVQLGDLQNILSNMGIPQQPGQPQQELLSLSSVLTPEDLTMILIQHPDIEQQLSQYLAPVPDYKKETVFETISSPVMTATLEHVSHVLNSGQGSGLFADLGLTPKGYGVDGLLNAMQDQANTQAAAASTETASSTNTQTAAPESSTDDSQPKPMDTDDTSTDPK